MAKVFSLSFGSGDPRTLTGLSPTFLIFVDQNGATQAPPAITEALTSSGIYKFTYTPTLAVMFLIDGGSGAGTQGRYVSGGLDPVQTVEQALGINSSLIALNLGSTNSSFGSTVSDPVDVIGYLKRIQENLEGNSTYSKTSGVWNIFSRGSSVLLISKTLNDGTSSTTKT